MQGFRGAEVQRCRETEVRVVLSCSCIFRCRVLTEMQRNRGSEVQMCRGAGAGVGVLDVGVGAEVQ